MLLVKKTEVRVELFLITSQLTVCVNEEIQHRAQRAQLVFHAAVSQSVSLSAFSFSLPFKNTLPREEEGGRDFPLWKI